MYSARKLKRWLPDQSQLKVDKLTAELPFFEQTLDGAAAAAGASRLRIKAGHRRRKKEKSG